MPTDNSPRRRLAIIRIRRKELDRALAAWFRTITIPPTERWSIADLPNALQHHRQEVARRLDVYLAELTLEGIVIGGTEIGGDDLRTLYELLQAAEEPEDLNDRLSLSEFTGLIEIAHAMSEAKGEWITALQEILTEMPHEPGGEPSCRGLTLVTVPVIGDDSDS